MPLYDYACRAVAITEFRSGSYRTPKKAVECPECNSRRIERQMSVPAKPRSDGGALPMASCSPQAPSCGPGCCRILSFRV